MSTRCYLPIFFHYLDKTKSLKSAIASGAEFTVGIGNV